MKIIILMSLLINASWVYSQSHLLPENNLHIPVGAKGMGGISEAEYNRVIDKIETTYAPIVSNLGHTLKISRLWTDAKVNARATRDGGTWNLLLYGGLPRHPLINADSFALTVCHELGHHLGGFPRVSVDPSVVWMANEGQADYFATTKCMRRIFQFDNNEAVVKNLNAPATLVTACKKNHSNANDRAVCIRSGIAAVSLVYFLSAFDKPTYLKFETPDKNVVAKTNDYHPFPQCRMDTFFQGALCEKSFNEDFSQVEEVKGACHALTGQTVGLRPRCWFKPSK